MADYYPLLKRTIGRLDRPDPRARRDIYDRAKQALINQMRGAGASDSDINAQLDAIDEAVSRIEKETAGAAAAPPARSVPLRRDPPSVDPAFEAPRDATTALRRGPPAMMVVGVMAAVLVAGFGAYYLVVRDRPPAATAPAPAVRSETTRQAATPLPPAAAKPEATLVDDDQASYVLRRQRVFYRTTHPPGTIVVSRSQRFLYLVQPNQVAIRYAIGTGPECENVVGLFHITEKFSLPSQTGAPAATPSPNSRVRLPEQFGPRALYFDGAHAVHGTATPHQIGQSAPAGCFLSWKPDIVDLYDRVQLNDRVVVAN